MNKSFFNEEQKFSTPWIWLVIFPALGLLIFFLKFNELNSDIANQGEKDDIIGLLIIGGFMFVMMTGLTILFYKMRLLTQVKPDGVYFKYPPFVNKERLISKAEISSFEIRKYNPRREYNGHGVKKGRRFKQSGMAYTVSGRIGLQIYLKNGKKILIGTKRKEALKHAMEKMMNKDWE